MIQTALTREKDGSRFLEFVSVQENNSVATTQIEMRNGRIFMRTKRRTYVFT